MGTGQQRAPSRSRGPHAREDRGLQAQLPTTTGQAATTPTTPSNIPAQIVDQDVQTSEIAEQQPSRRNPRSNTPLFGSLKLREPVFYIQAPPEMLKIIIASAPERVRTAMPLNASKELMLAEVFRLRQEEAIANKPTSPTPEEALKEVISMDHQEIIHLSASNPTTLKSLMKSALQADATLNPRIIPQRSEELAITVLTWQVQAHKQVQQRSQPQTAQAQPIQRPRSLPRLSFMGHDTTHETVEPTIQPERLQTQNQPSTPALADIFANLPAPANRGTKRHPIVDTSEEEEAERAKKKRKASIFPKGFTYGAGSTIDQVLSTYPGNRPGCNSLNINELRGPQILAGIIGGGQDVPSFLHRFQHWKKTQAGLPTHAEVEAYNLGRMIHMELLNHQTPKEALENRPSLEIGLRRLYAILYVEEKVNTAEVPDRGSAWNEIQFIMESQPLGTVMNEEINEDMTRRLNLRKKRLTAVKAMQEQKSKRLKDPQKDQGGQNREQGPQRRPSNRQ